MVMVNTFNNTIKDLSGVTEALNKAENAINGGAGSVPATATPAGASDVAKLKAFVNKNGLALNRGTKVYLLAEAWQFVAFMKGLVPTYESASETIELASGEKQYTVTTTCRLLKKSTLEEVSRSTMIASSNEDFLKDKPNHAVWGMSETRAMSRAVKNIYGYIARDAGYQATPFEEI